MVPTGRKSFFEVAARDVARMDRTRSLILDAALETFDGLGYAATPVPVVATRAQLAVGSLYRYFPSKEDLANAVYRRERYRLARSLLAELDFDHAEPAREAFAGLWGRLADVAVEHTDGLSFLELHFHDPYLDDESLALDETTAADAAGHIGRWQARGEVRDGDPRDLYLQALGGFTAVLRQVRRRHESVTRDRMLTTLEPAWALLAAP